MHRVDSVKENVLNHKDIHVLFTVTIHSLTYFRADSYSPSTGKGSRHPSAFDDEQGGSFTSWDQQRTLHEPLKNRDRIGVNSLFDKDCKWMARSGWWELGSGKYSWQWVEHAWLYFGLLQALKGEHSSALGLQHRAP